MTVTALHPAQTAEVRPHGITRYKHGPGEHGQPDTGCRCGVCSQASRDYENRRARMIAYGRWEGRIDATGTRRRIQALMRNGWQPAPLGRHLGISRQSMRQMLGYAQVSARTAEKVRVLYDSLWDQAPPQRDRLEKRAATLARRAAAERGWPPPAAWDDDTIDDPAASPAEGWEPREGVRRWGVLGEDSAFLLAAGEEPWRVAERLGVSPKTLDTVLMRERQREEARYAA